MSTNVSSFYFHLCFKAGAKVEILFVSCKKNLKFFLKFFQSQSLRFSYQSLNELPCFAGCKCKKHFQISQAFLNLFFVLFLKPRFLILVSISMNAFAVAGAKVAHLFTFPTLFFIFFPSFSILSLNSLGTASLHFELFY